MPFRSLTEKIVLGILISFSLAGFGFQFRRFVRVLSAAKPDRDFKIGALSPRIRQFVREVILQAKVIRQRPLAGVAHAFVFWGFCAFALITVNHIATGFGVPLFSQAEGFGRIYFGFAALFAVA